MLRRLAVASAVFAAACAGQQKGDVSKQSAPVQERLRITNQPIFDVANCHPRELTLPQPLNQAGIIGALDSKRPQILECLVDPKNRGPEKQTRVTVKTTIDTTGGKHTVSGTNLTPSGAQCVQDVVDKAIPLAALPAGSEPVEHQVDFSHEVGSTPSVTFGINEGSDFSGTVRLAQATWCDCYTGFAEQTPPLLTARIKLQKGLEHPAEVTFEPSGSTEGDALAACLQPKIAALPASVTTDELTYPHRFIHLNSQAGENVANLPPELAFFQLDLVRSQRAADVALTFGMRDNAAGAYDAVVSQYQKTKNWRLIDELKAKCAALVSAADAWVAAIEAQQQTDQRTLELVQSLKAQDSSWADTEAGLQKALAQTGEDLKLAQARRQADEAACPKERKR